MTRRSNRGRAFKAVPPTAGGVSFTPAQMAAALAAQQQLSGGKAHAQPMPTSPFWETSPFGPGRRLPPAPINVPREDTGRAEPRLWEYPVSWNLQISDRWHVPWQTLQSAADMPLFRKCIERRKSVCQLDFTVTVDPRAVAREAQASGSATKDVESELRQQYTSEISRVTDWLQVPDRKNDLDWGAWTSLLMENRLKFDAACVYPRKTYGGDLFALEVIDGKTIKPLLDEYGGRPMPPYPAFQQVLYGFPRGEFTAATDNPDGTSAVPGGYSSDQLYYERSIYRSESPYGMSATEIALFDGLMWMRRMGWMMAEYTEGMIPAGVLTTTLAGSGAWTPRQWEDWQRGLNDHLSGNTAERQRFPLLPPDVGLVQQQEVAERYKPDYDMFLIKLIAGDFGLPASEVGFTEAGALGASFHEGEEDILNRQTRMPDAKWLGNYATKLAIRELGMPPALRVEVLGLESEDEAAADTVAQGQVASARLTLNEDRARRGLPAYPFAEADMAMMQTGRGVVFLEGASEQAAPGTLVGPAVAPPAVAPPAGAQDGSDGQGGGEGEQGAPAAKSLPSARELRDWGLSGGAIAEVAAYRRYLAKGDRKRPFAFQALDCGDALAHVITEADIDAGRVTFPLLKADDAGPKALSGTGPAGSGTSSW